MAEELNAYLAKLDINCNYIHSDVDTLDRIKILDDLRAGVYDVLIGVNLLREGLDLPEVSLVAILDADKEGFLRSHRSLTQTVGRAARNLNGRVIMYADRITESMQKTIDETNRRREKQLAYNEENHITPQAIQKSKSSVLVSNADTKQQAQPSKANKPTKAYSDEYRGTCRRRRRSYRQIHVERTVAKGHRTYSQTDGRSGQKNGFHRSGTISGRAYKTRRFISKNNHDYLNL